MPNSESNGLSGLKSKKSRFKQGPGLASLNLKGPPLFFYLETVMC